MKQYLLISLICLVSCVDQTSEKPKTITSQYHNFEITYKAPWAKINPYLDTEDQLILGIINQTNGSSCVIKIEIDSSAKDVPNELYFQAVAEQMQQANSKNRLLEEKEVTFHQQIYHQQTYLMYTDKWGLLKQYLYILKKDESVSSIQMAFPVNEHNKETASIPEELLKLDQAMKINE